MPLHAAYLDAASRYITTSPQGALPGRTLSLAQLLGGVRGSTPHTVPGLRPSCTMLAFKTAVCTPLAVPVYKNNQNVRKSMVVRAAAEAATEDVCDLECPLVRMVSARPSHQHPNMQCVTC